MPEVAITYCVPCRYRQKALQDADAILRQFGQQLTEVRLIPGDHGVYDVHLDDDLIFSLDKAEHFPETSELVDAIRARISAAQA